MDKKREAVVNSIFKEVLKSIKPSDLEVRSIIANVNMLTSRLRGIVPRDVEIRVAGSIAHGTNLKGYADVDIFLLFDNKYNKERLGRMGLEYGKKIVKKKDGESYEIKYAEHPYLRLYSKKTGLKADIVPASKIENAENLATAVDRSPLHTEFLNANLSERQRDDTRLLKFLLKAHNIYGAEVKVGGFSGYLCELLVYQYGSILKLLEGIASLKTPTILDPKKRAILRDEELFKKFDSDFIVIDPVDANRNVAAAVRSEALARFVLIAREFLKKPSIDLFYSNKFSSLKTVSLLEGIIKDFNLDIYLLCVKTPDKSTDVIWPQLRKVSEHILDYIKRNGFEPYISSQWIEESRNEGLMLIATPRIKMHTRLVKGPDVLKTEASSDFIKKHDKAMGFVMRGSTIHALENSAYTDVAEIMEEFSRGKMMARHKDISIKNAKLFVNKIPKEYSENAYIELSKALGF